MFFSLSGLVLDLCGVVLLHESDELGAWLLCPDLQLGC